MRLQRFSWTIIPASTKSCVSFSAIRTSRRRSAFMPVPRAYRRPVITPRRFSAFVALTLDRRSGVTEGSARVPRCIKPLHWPEQDSAAWAAAHRRGGLLDDDGLAASWAPATSDIIARGYGSFLAFLAQDNDLDPAASPADRLTRPRIQSYIDYLREQNHSSTIAARILQLIRAIAVMAPAADLAWLRRVFARLRRTATPARNDRTRLLPAATLLDLAKALMQRAETEVDQ